LQLDCFRFVFFEQAEEESDIVADIQFSLEQMTQFVESEV
jgi:hypothetical protein